MARIIPAFSQFLDDNGEPLVNGTLRFLESDTNNTEKTTYSDSEQVIPNTNPVQLNGAGRCPDVFGDGLYNIVSYNESDQLIEQFDPVGVDTVQGAFSDWNSVVIYSAGTIVTASDGSYYRAITGTNQNNEPSANPNDWELIKIIGEWNSVISYSINDAVYGSDGDLYFSIGGSNTNNDPVSSPTLWRFGGLSIAAAGTDTYTATIGISAYTTNKRYDVNFANANTAAAPTLNFDSLGAKTILDSAGAALVAGELAGTTALEYNGTNFILLNSNVDNALSRLASGTTESPKMTRASFAATIRAAYLGSGSLGAKTVSASENLASGEYHYTSLTINTGQTLGCSNSSGGFLIIRVQGDVIIDGTGSINLDGKGGAGGTSATTTNGGGGAAGFGGGSGGGGGCSLTYDGGAGGDSEVRSALVSGGIPGVYVSGSGTDGGNGVTTTALMQRSIDSGFEFDVFKPYGGGGGGGGSDAGSQVGKNGGGCVIIIADTITVDASATIKCNGIDGGDSDGGGNLGGGGGGGGGIVILAANTITDNGTTTVAGGAVGSNLSGASSAGGAGGDGYFLSATFN